MIQEALSAGPCSSIFYEVIYELGPGLRTLGWDPWVCSPIRVQGRRAVSLIQASIGST